MFTNVFPEYSAGVVYGCHFLKICRGCIQHQRGGGWHMPLSL